ncbi:MAG TPA: hypothetical protein VNC22_08210 [Sporichthya sp.]|nr:hypothetical protein [Sporichthya sp.]
MEQLMVVFSNPVVGREDEFNEWYQHVHIRDVMLRCPGARWVQRYRLAADQPPDASPRYRYVAVYAGDHRGFTEGHRAHIFSEQMPISAAFEVADHRAAYYLVRAGDDASAVLGPRLLVERFAAGLDPVDGFAERRAGPGIAAGLVATVAEHQLFPQHADTAAVGLYGTDTAPPWPLPAPGTERGRYDALAAPLTVAEAQAPSVVQRDRTARVRAGLDRLRGGAR